MIVEGIDDLEDGVKKIGEEVMDFEEEVVGGRREYEWEKKIFVEW